MTMAHHCFFYNYYNFMRIYVKIHYNSELMILQMKKISFSDISLSIGLLPIVHGAMGCSQKSLKPVWRIAASSCQGS